ncbi:hypothetical protein ME763_06935 [Streptomyces murinus]|uniref:hypothetical protein n=1 Tax=Streptomyces murinus TaxID=33900 RepID=UPI000A1DB264|nr:hypothetical protein [Streptomyces murinus]WDO05407.1 hypothetical protein ME763_06935 [Streptomyces murinus]
MHADHDGRLIHQAAEPPSRRAPEPRCRTAGRREPRAVADDSAAMAADLLRALWGNRWIFGGRYVGAAARRRRAPAAAGREAVGQAVDHLAGLDENRARIRAEPGIETRRADALVLVGHPALHADVPEEEVAETLRTCDAHVTRGEALACKERVDNAERSLAVGVGPA